ncbi:hypothetical protein GTH52_14970 (plasmid) [Clostridium tyrobutyricum]|jgi:hypothetical protein|uniref:Conjugation protein n=1 Tax=Clostridium tyrobutyricum DIVETGP TaxID=1408889 RepID=W6NGQ9_CLOTY|nr:hypothetical protein [Clostridium tyrobutyricum]AND86332.1 TraC-like protein [Clostridium tyrobutyricum]ANP70928.1 hypothetical protein BA182_14615 [Clostridium tyrobutyricum]MBV4432463.1 hypothetical protein [Clostridium tyrobutyricum]MBV4435684.1 hypothetical protein [Clostridium tyrobutyricum]QNB68188.1 hypothetical protein GTH52_14970 [Clostridium tyrobutyricum]
MNISKDDIKKALLEMLDDDGEKREGKKFIFPRNVESSYNLIPGLTGIDAIKYVSIPLLISVVILAIPPYSILGLWIVKALLAVALLAGGFILAIARPVKYRNNIRCVEYLKNILSFYSRQKMFFLKPKKRGEVK